MSDGKKHLGIVIVGHVDAGKSTTTGRLLFELGGMTERELAKLKKEAKELGKESFLFAFFMDKSEDERKRGITVACTTREFYTDSYHYSIIDAPGHRFVLFLFFSIIKKCRKYQCKFYKFFYTFSTKISVVFYIYIHCQTTSNKLKNIQRFYQEHDIWSISS